MKLLGLNSLTDNAFKEKSRAQATSVRKGPVEPQYMKTGYSAPEILKPATSNPMEIQQWLPPRR